MGFLHGCKYHFGTRYGEITEPAPEPEEFGFRYHPMYYRFHRYIPRRRLWRGW